MDRIDINKHQSQKKRLSPDGLKDGEIICLLGFGYCDSAGASPAGL